jgi:hypothetical protein
MKSGLTLDSRHGWANGGDRGPALIPGDVDGSRLIRAVRHTDPELRMPEEKLSGTDIALLEEWVRRGAPDPRTSPPKQKDEVDWALRPLVTPKVPAGTPHPVDAFLQEKLTQQGLTPVPTADRRTLIRRLSYDLTGLPPTPDEADAFAADSDPHAYDRLVDRLLASPRHGEHWARHWLDAAHYADTHGNDHDYARPNAWPYRDYVIQTLNEDLPYPLFVQQQIAGDVLFPDDPRAVTALGFLAAGPWDETLMVGVREDTVDHRMAQVLDRDDMVTTVMSTFQSLTVHCARCHNHKFDPISQRDYYALQAVFAGVDRADRPFDDDPATHQRRRDLLARRKAIERRSPELLASLTTPEILSKVALVEEREARRNELWSALDVVSVTSASGADTAFVRQPDGSWLVSGARPERDTFIITARTAERDLRALRLEALPDPSLPGGGPGRYDPAGNFHLTEFRASAQPSTGEGIRAQRIEFGRATATHSDRGDGIANAIDGRDDTYWSVHPRYGEPHEAVFEFKEPVDHPGGTTFILRLEHEGKPAHQLGRFRLSCATGRLPPQERPPLPSEIRTLLRTPPSQRSPADTRELALNLLRTEVEDALAALPAPRQVYAVTPDFPAQGSFKPALAPRPIHLLIRGDVNRPGEAVGPAALGCVPDLPGTLDFRTGSAEEESARRAALARWLTDPRNVLTWRSIVNRIWHWHFGRGLSDTPNDFGRMGSAPSHPELLDWLAVWFRDDARGSLKALHRLIVTSEAYRRRSDVPAEARAADPENRLLARSPRRRLSAEQLRDSLLQASGRLDLTLGGPSVVQFVAQGKATFMPDGGAPPLVDYENFPPAAPENRRRAVYRFQFRTVPDPLLDALGAPDGGSLTPVRSVSTTAVQAFALLNNPFVIHECSLIAERAGDVRQAFRLLLLRDPFPREWERLTAYAQRHGLANTVQLLINSNEFMHLE